MFAIIILNKKIVLHVAQFKERIYIISETKIVLSIFFIHEIRIELLTIFAVKVLHDRKLRLKLLITQKHIRHKLDCCLLFRRKLDSTL